MPALCEVNQIVDIFKNIRILRFFKKLNIYWKAKNIESTIYIM